MNKMKLTLGSLVLTGAFVLMPFAANAASVNASSTTGVVINPQGIVRVIGADVTSVGNGVINAVTTIGNTVINWIVNISATTKVNGSANATTTGISVGDKVAFKGALTGTSSTGLTVSATKVRDATTFQLNMPGLHKGDKNDATSTDPDNDGDHGKGEDKPANVNANANAKVHAGGAHEGLDLFGGLHLGLGRDN